MPTVYEETSRILLGRVTLLAAAPVGVPAAGPGIVQNVYSLELPPGLVQRETRRMRFKMAEVILDFTGGAVTGLDLLVYYSRINPAPVNRGAVAEALPDNWSCPGGQAVLAVPTAAAGNRVEIAPRGVRWIALVGLNPVGGVATDVDAWVYGIMSGPGGGW